MAIVYKKILGASRKRVGDVVFRNWKGETISSAYNPIVKNPNTRSQQLVRARFAALTKLAQMFAPATYVGLRDAVAGSVLTPRNLFIKKNWPAVTATAPDNVTTDYTSIVVAKGSYADSLIFGTPRFDNPLQVELSFSFSSSISPSPSANVLVYVFVYCPDVDGRMLAVPVAASQSSITITVPGYWSGQKVHLWGFMVYNGENDVNTGTIKGAVNNSVYIGTGTIS